MSKDSFKPNPPPPATSSLSNLSKGFNVAVDLGSRTGGVNTPSASSSVAGPSVFQVPTTKRSGEEASTKSKKVRKRTAEENEIKRETAHRFASRLALDHIAVLYPDIDTPFADTVDVVHRLLPYHVFQHPQEDLDRLRGARKDKDGGTGKAIRDDLRKEIAETKFALECHKRRKLLQERFRRARISAGKRPSPDDQAYALAQVVLEADSTETTSLSTEVRNARTELERIEREKRVVNRPTYYSAQPTPYYRGFQYAYTQPYGAPMQTNASSSSAFPAPATATSITATNHTPPLTGAIPVLLPVASLPALHALGILPVPATSLPPADQPQPPAVMRGSSANGTMLNLEINVSLLQQAQMSGLAIVLSSLISRGVTVDPTAASSSNSSHEASVANDT